MISTINPNVIGPDSIRDSPRQVRDTLRPLLEAKEFPASCVCRFRWNFNGPTVSIS
jgi:hypothetical protein